MRILTPEDPECSPGSRKSNTACGPRALGHLPQRVHTQYFPASCKASHDREPRIVPAGDGGHGTSPPPLGNGDLQVERTPSEIDLYFPVDLGPVGVVV